MNDDWLPVNDDWLPEISDGWVAATLILMCAAFVIASIYWQW